MVWRFVKDRLGVCFDSSIKFKVSACRASEREESITSPFCRLMDSARANEWGRERGTLWIPISLHRDKKNIRWEIEKIRWGAKEMKAFFSTDRTRARTVGTQGCSSRFKRLEYPVRRVSQGPCWVSYGSVLCVLANGDGGLNPNRTHNLDQS